MVVTRITALKPRLHDVLLLMSLVLFATPIQANMTRQGRPAMESLTSEVTETGVEFTIHANHGVEYRYFTLENPKRLVLDFLSAENQLGIAHLAVGIHGVRQVRAAQFESPDREATRVVFDLERDVPFEIDAGDSTTFRVRFAAPAGPSSSSGSARPRAPDPEAVHLTAEDEQASHLSAPPPELVPLDRASAGPNNSSRVVERRETGSPTLPEPNRNAGRLTAPAVEVPILDGTDSPARSAKAIGDRYRAEDRIPEAVEEYRRALALGRDRFTTDERVAMAVTLSWEDALNESIEELKLVLRDDPEHIQARAHLARVYSWSGALSESIDQAEWILAREPDHPDALLVKADALEWQGYFKKAIPIYRRVLEQGSSFDAGLGLSYALLSMGNRTAARQNARQLDIGTLRQGQQLADLVDAIDQTGRPQVELRHNYYEDSDENQSNRYALAYKFGLGNHDFGLSFSRTDGRNSEEQMRSESASLNVRSNLRDGLALGGGIGLTRPDGANGGDLLTGQFLMEAAVSNGGIDLGISHSVLEDTAELIGNQIRLTRYGVSFGKPLTDRLSLSGSYAYKDYSDGNHSHDVDVSPEYIVVLRPRVTLGYAFRFTDFRTQSRSGFFDPNNYASNRLFGSFYLERNRFYAYMNVFAGRQTFSRNGFGSDDFVTGGSASLGFTPSSNVALELNADGGNFSAGSVTGFRYFILGSRLAIRF